VAYRSGPVKESADVEMAFALAAAVLYGSADFLGGTASRRVRAQSVLAVSAPAGAIVILAAALALGSPFRASGMAWAFAAGAAGGAGLIMFYGGLAAAPMSVVAPVSALMSTVLPVGVAVTLGERAGLSVYAGALICLLAIGLVSMDTAGDASGDARTAAGGDLSGDASGDARTAAGGDGADAAGPVGAGGRPARPPATARGLGYGIASGIAFGVFFLFIRNAGTAGVLWPVCVARVAGTLVILAAAAWLRTPPAGWGSGRASRAGGAGRRVVLAAVAAGVLDAGANVCYVLAARAGLFGMAVVITSLYPGITVLLARVVLGERMHAIQRLGLLLAAAGIGLVTF
jgi:drug/metabolite transporter (DMT)-like permease